MSLKDWIKGRVAAFDAAVRPWAEASRLNAAAYEFLLFGLKQAWACLFGGAMLALLVGTHFLWPPSAPLARYDVLVIAAVGLQGLLLATRLERWEEAAVIAIFHVVGTIMELFKTDVGSWIYPEPAVFRIGGVPLFSGFMYASIGSYIARAWRLFDFRFERHPPLWTLGILGAAIYANFYAHHYIADLRVALFAATALLLGRTQVDYRVWLVYRRMPLLLGLFLVASFIWIAENLGTLTATWLYPHQTANVWSLVKFGKLGSWFLLLIVSYTLVAAVNRPLQRVRGEQT